MVSFKQMLWRSGFTDISVAGKQRIAKYLHVTPRTINRWLETDKPSKQAIELLNVKKVNLRQSISWEGFVFRDDYLVTPDGSRLTANELRVHSLYMQLMRAVLDNQDKNKNNEIIRIKQNITQLVTSLNFS